MIQVFIIGNKNLPIEFFFYLGHTSLIEFWLLTMNYERTSVSGGSSQRDSVIQMRQSFSGQSYLIEAIMWVYVHVCAGTGVCKCRQGGQNWVLFVSSHLTWIFDYFTHIEYLLSLELTK